MIDTWAEEMEKAMVPMMRQQLSMIWTPLFPTNEQRADAQAKVAALPDDEIIAIFNRAGESMIDEEEREEFIAELGASVIEAFEDQQESKSIDGTSCTVQGVDGMYTVTITGPLP